MVAITSFQSMFQTTSTAKTATTAADFVHIGISFKLHRRRADPARFGCVRRRQAGIHGWSAPDGRYRARSVARQDRSGSGQHLQGQGSAGESDGRVAEDAGAADRESRVFQGRERHRDPHDHGRAERRLRHQYPWAGRGSRPRARQEGIVGGYHRSGLPGQIGRLDRVGNGQGTGEGQPTPIREKLLPPVRPMPVRRPFPRRATHSPRSSRRRMLSGHTATATIPNSTPCERSYKAAAVPQARRNRRRWTRHRHS